MLPTKRLKMIEKTPEELEVEKQDLEADVIKAETKLSELEEGYGVKKLGLENEIAALTPKKEYLEDQVEIATKKLAKIRPKLKDALTELKTVNKQIEEGKQTLKTTKAAIVTAEGEKTIIEGKVKRRKAAVDKEVELYKAEAVAAADLELAEVNEEIGDAKTELAELRVEVTEKETAISELAEQETTQTELLTTKLDGIKANITEEKAELKEVKAKKAVANKQLTNISYKVGEMSQKLAIAEKNHDDFLKYESKTRNELQARSDFLDTREEELAVQSRKLASRRAALGNLSR